MRNYISTTTRLWMWRSALAVILCFASIAANSDPHVGQSVNVAIIDSPFVINGGNFPTAANPAFAAFNFTNMSVANVNAANLANYDTVLLNVASSGMGCNVNVLTASQKADLVSFVALGNKLIISDSECPPQNYAWLPFPFTTSNPGALGQTGTLTIVEENTLSSNNNADPHYINAPLTGSNTDAIGDMNVMTTLDPNWCVDMSGTNALQVTGPVHTYAKTGTDVGLYIYIGFDQDFLGSATVPSAASGSGNLAKVWLQQLQEPFNPSNLPCGITVVGITLDPASDTNIIGESHTVTATLVDLLGAPQSGIVVNFSVLAGPNAGAGGVCSANADCSTDANGQVSFTYNGVGGVGQDSIEACFTNAAGEVICSRPVTKDWEPPPNEPPDCTDAAPSVDLLWPPNHKFHAIAVTGVTDPDGDAVTINIDSIWQDEPVKSPSSGNTSPDGMGVGTDTAHVRAERAGSKKVSGNGRVYHIGFTADDGNGATCSSEVLVGVPHDQGNNSVPVDDGSLYDSTIP